jgi:hypothetical protein
VLASPGKVHSVGREEFPIQKRFSFTLPNGCFSTAFAPQKRSENTIVCHSTIRINLVTPFAEKDAVKALGARWDAAKKCWYIVDIADFTPFKRWISDLKAAVDMSGGTTLADKPNFSLPTPPPNAQTKSVKVVADCGCDVLPWDDCVHTAKA